MTTFPDEFLSVMIQYNGVFSKRVFSHVQVLLAGAILTIGKRTVSSVLRTMGLSEIKGFGKYHRVLSRAKWSALACSWILLIQILELLHPGDKLVFGIDETLERRWGKKISKRGIYRDSARSSRSHFVKCSGLRWISLMLLADIPWAARVWALPFLTALAPSERYAEKKGVSHKKVTDWARQMILQLSRWLPNKELIVVADGGYACVELLASVSQHVTMITTFRMDAAIYKPAPSRPPGKRGPHRKKGDKLPKLTEVVENSKTHWQTIKITEWYGHRNKKMEVATGTAVWYRSGKPVVPLRWVLLRDPDQKLQTRAILCTDLTLDLKEVVTYYVRRWSVEVTFEEVRKHLGVETQRQWSDKAIERTTPVLMGLFSLVTILADRQWKQGLLKVEETTWYKKAHPTFSDAIANVRGILWGNFNFAHSDKEQECAIIPKQLFKHMQHILSYAT